MIFKKNAIKYLSEKLVLPFTGLEQDWCLEMSNTKRLDEFIDFYKKNKLSDDEKQVLMCLVISSYDDYLNELKIPMDNKWKEIKILLENERNIFVEIIEYWAIPKEQDVFKVTPLIREIQINNQ